MVVKVGLIGCGTIGTILARAIDRGDAGDTELVAVYDKVEGRSRELVEKLSRKPMIARSAEQLMSADVDIVVEAASQQAVKEYASEVLRRGRDLMIMSVGALADGQLLNELEAEARKTGKKVYVPSGAITGLDGLKSAMVKNVQRVTLTTRKPIRALEGSPYFKLRKIDPRSIKGPTLLYEGNALEACKLFPSNINVAATLSLAGIGPEKTLVRVVADPSLDRIVHEISIKGDFGELKTNVENLPSPDNPKTSYLAALSAVATLRKLTEPVLIGT